VASTPAFLARRRVSMGRAAKPRLFSREVCMPAPSCYTPRLLMWMAHNDSGCLPRYTASALEALVLGLAFPESITPLHSPSSVVTAPSFSTSGCRSSLLSTFYAFRISSTTQGRCSFNSFPSCYLCEAGSLLPTVFTQPSSPSGPHSVAVASQASAGAVDVGQQTAGFSFDTPFPEDGVS